MRSDGWDKFLEGDDTAFSLIYDAYFDGLYAFGLYLGFDEDMCKDAIHDIFYSLYASKDKLSHIKNIKSFLLISVKNRLIYLQKENILRRADDIGTITLSDESPDFLDILIDNEFKKMTEEKIAALLATLRPNQRKAIYYRFFMNLKYSDIAVIMEIKPDSVKKMLQRAIKELRKSNDLTLFLHFLTIFLISSFLVNVC